ncbi:MAG: hypothetical protein LAT55_11660 [Opitutales bacterium]|nr:hypothetical protein [Opitutales bacterium]
MASSAKTTGRDETLSSVIVPSPQRSFSHLYIEKEALDEPDTKLLRKRFPQATVVEIDRYTEIFNRSGQSFAAQKAVPKLILAKKREDLLYRGSPYTPNFGHRRFFYNAMILNCLYNCEYCYLQGMYRSGNLVWFVNSGDFFQAVAEELKQGPLYLCISYDTDMLAFENLLPLCARWAEFSRKEPGLTIELRTKSANYRALGRNAEAHERFILAWTLSPEAVSRRYEQGTPPIAQRLASAREAMEAGWPVRLCFDPVLLEGEWEEDYRQLFAEAFAQLDPKRLQDVSVGFFRSNRDFLKTMRRQRPDSALLNRPWQADADKQLTYPTSEIEEARATLRSELLRYLPEGNIHFA